MTKIYMVNISMPQNGFRKLLREIPLWPFIIYIPALIFDALATISKIRSPYQEWNDIARFFMITFGIKAGMVLACLVEVLFELFSAFLIGIVSFLILVLIYEYSATKDLWFGFVGSVMGWTVAHILGGLTWYYPPVSLLFLRFDYLLRYCWLIGGIVGACINYMVIYWKLNRMFCFSLEMKKFGS